MINPAGYSVYGQPSQYNLQRAVAQGAGGNVKVAKQSSHPPLGQKVIPGSEQESFLIDKFGEKKLKELDILPCETCANRRYQDDSDDPGVSFQTPQHIAPEASGAMVMAHEQEHVVRERASAEMEGREVVSQSVTLHSSICPECGKIYVAGGVTKTTTRAKDAQDEAEKFIGNLFDVKL